MRPSALCALLSFLFALTLAGCGGAERDTAVVPEPLEEPVATDPKPQSPGTLWNGDEGSWLSDIKARRVGDIVTVIIEEKAKASKQATTDTEPREAP